LAVRSSSDRKPAQKFAQSFKAKEKFADHPSALVEHLEGAGDRLGGLDHDVTDPGQ
jgi:hypothetical protein